MIPHAALLGGLLLIGAVATAQQPEKDVSAARYPLSRQAWERIGAAQQANEWNLQGHAQKAKELLDQVNQELKLAAEAANRKGR
jgi:hypothetical protein